MPKDTLSVTDNRTGKSYELAISDGTIKATELRQILVDSAVRYTDNEVGEPGDGALVRFGTLSVTGGVVNAAEAVRLAMERSGN